MHEEDLKEFRCPNCRRRLLELNTLEGLGMLSVKCKRCKQVVKFFTIKNKFYPINKEFGQRWQKYLKKEFEEYIITLSNE